MILLDTHALVWMDADDRFIAATAIQRGATLLTGDARLLAWHHPLRGQDARK